MNDNQIKIGRWTYPVAVQNGSVVRNEKRDGSGAWVPVTEAQMPKAEQDSMVSKVKPESEDYGLLKQVYSFVFDSFATDYDEIGSQFNLRPGRAKAAVSRLVRFGLVAVDHRDRADGKPGKEYVIQPFQSYDNWTNQEAMADFDVKVPNDVRIPNPSTHGGVKGAQTRKPGKSTWKVGTPCPQGHILKAGRIYTMPSGRHICLECRDGYNSVQARKSGVSA